MSDLYLDSYTKQLALEMGLPTTSEEGGKDLYSLSFGQDLTISARSLQPGFSFFAKLGLVPTQNAEELFSLLMLGNLLGQGTGDALIGLNDEGNTLTISLDLPRQMSYAQFKENVENFVNYVDVWQKKISDASASPTQPSSHGG